MGVGLQSSVLGDSVVEFSVLGFVLRNSSSISLDKKNMSESSETEGKSNDSIFVMLYEIVPLLIFHRSALKYIFLNKLNKYQFSTNLK